MWDSLLQQLSVLLIVILVSSIESVIKVVRILKSVICSVSRLDLHRNQVIHLVGFIERIHANFYVAGHFVERSMSSRDEFIENWPVRKLMIEHMERWEVLRTCQWIRNHLRPFYIIRIRYTMSFLPISTFQGQWHCLWDSMKTLEEELNWVLETSAQGIFLHSRRENFFTRSLEGRRKVTNLTKSVSPMKNFFHSSHFPLSLV